MSISDELDHLGLYIEKNMYSLDVAKLENCHVFYGGYREDLDKYFSPIHLGKSIEKPQQFISEEIRKILNACTEKSGKDIVRFTNFLLDMSDEAREIFSDSIRSLSNRELELGRMIPATFFGDLNYVLSVKLPNIESASKEKQREYVLATIAKNKRESVFRIEVAMNLDGKIMDVDFDYFTQEDISDDKRQYLIELGDYYTKSRMQSFLIQNHKKKIYPNDYCPCGSGKKYKKCCGK